MQQHCDDPFNLISVQLCRCCSCTYCRENSTCGNSCRHTALPRRGTPSHGTLCTCCLHPSLALCVLRKERWKDKMRSWISRAAPGKVLCGRCLAQRHIDSSFFTERSLLVIPIMFFVNTFSWIIQWVPIIYKGMQSLDPHCNNCICLWVTVWVTVSLDLWLEYCWLNWEPQLQTKT